MFIDTREYLKVCFAPHFGYTAICPNQNFTSFEMIKLYVFDGLTRRVLNILGIAHLDPITDTFYAIEYNSGFVITIQTDNTSSVIPKPVPMLPSNPQLQQHQYLLAPLFIQLLFLQLKKTKKINN